MYELGSEVISQYIGQRIKAGLLDTVEIDILGHLLFLGTTK